MDRGIGERWLQALESSEYLKGAGQLAGEDGEGRTCFCCLGVLAELARQDGVEFEKEWVGEVCWYDHERNFLPLSVIEWAGLGSNNGTYVTDEEAYSLAELNDEAGDFVPVIEAIREHMEAL